MIRTIIRQDWWMIRQHFLYKLLTLVFGVCLLLALWNGNGIYQSKMKTHAAIDSIARQQPVDHLQQVKAIEETGVYTGSPFSDPRAPYAVATHYAARYITYSLHPLAKWNTGQSDIQATYYKVTASKRQALLVNEEIANPQVQFTGYFDIAFVIIYLLPLFVIGFTYNISAQENEFGTLRMLLSEPVSITKIIAVKFVFRFLLTSVLLWTLLVLLALVSKVPLHDGRWFQFAAGAGCYTLLWFGVSWLFNACSRKNSGTTASLLAAFWLCFIVLVPGIINMIATGRYPMPSRIDLITQTREAAADISKKNSDVLGKYLQDHPELVSDTVGMNYNDFAVKAFTAVVETEKITAPLRNLFDEQLGSQQKIAATLGYCSPALVLQQSFNYSAATHEDDFRAFKEHVGTFFTKNRTFHTNRIISQKRFTSEELSSLPEPGAFEVADTKKNTYIYFVLFTMVCLLSGWVLMKRRLY